MALIYTSIENLPVKERSENEHKWIGDFCGKCGKCIKNCPGNAILEQPIAHNSNYLTHIQNDKCYPHFYGNYDCSICIKVCSFNQNEYENLKNR
ncbi:MAG: hypothetical protein GY870_00155 [archaeon]|nr:hypothetical protein [archaeon]